MDARLAFIWQWRVGLPLCMILTCSSAKPSAITQPISAALVDQVDDANTKQCGCYKPCEICIAAARPLKVFLRHTWLLYSGKKSRRMLIMNKIEC